MANRHFGFVLAHLLMAACMASCGSCGEGEKVATGPAIVVERIVAGDYKANCYVAHASETDKAIVIDPGADAARIFYYLTANGLDAEAVVFTHGHPDHIDAAPEIVEATGATVYRHPLCRAMSQRRKEIESLEWRPLEPGTRFRAGGLSFDVFHTPGHSPGSVCLLYSSEEEDILFTGDLLFKGTVGRTDFSGGDAHALESSLKKTLSAVPDQALVLPGHGESTTMGAERETNRFLAP